MKEQSVYEPDAGSLISCVQRVIASHAEFDC